ncbi:response regulator [Nitrospina gracilis]|nr:response regulator [Nitrospina gracilis]
MNAAINFLLVEDDEVDVKNVQRAFKKNNINNPLFVAGNGEEALEMLRGEGDSPIVPPPQVILLDLNMPKMGGLEFLQELRKDPRFKSLSVFILTTSDEERDKIAAYNFNIAGYILKPLEFGQFMETIKTLNAYWTLCEFPNR